jgi:uncharacterized Zn finger protein (UPF0148 family)
VSQTAECPRCGAPFARQADGRTIDCRYCGTRGQVSMDGEALAAGLRLDKANAEAILDRLAQELGAAFSDLTRIEKEGGRVVAFELTLEPDLFIMKRDAHHGVVAQHKRVSRGIALKTASHPIDRWVQMLSRALAEHVNTSTRASQALARLNLR